MESHTARETLSELAQNLGADAFGVCRTDTLIDRFHPEIRKRARTLPFAISIGIALQKAVMDTIVDRPNEIYKAHYRQLNARLDNITFTLAQTITDNGGQAIPIPASKVVSRYPMIGHVNHREVAYQAGLGWRGKNNLLINPHHGARIRLATVLTDLEMIPDVPLEQDCGTCKTCGKKCPVGAIGDSPDDFNLEKCRDQVIAFSRENNYGHLICGLCLNCCPVKNI